MVMRSYTENLRCGRGYSLDQRMIHHFTFSMKVTAVCEIGKISDMIEIVALSFPKFVQCSNVLALDALIARRRRGKGDTSQKIGKR